jgi:hypothetical protein
LRTGAAHGKLQVIPRLESPVSGVDQRSETRIHYREPLKAGLLVGALALDLIDVSESGLRFRSRDAPAPLAVGSQLDGIVCLRHGETAPVSGRVVRVDGNEVAARISDIRIPYGSLVAERLYVEVGRTGWRW